MRELLMWVAMVGMCAMSSGGCDDGSNGVVDDADVSDANGGDTVTPPTQCWTERSGDNVIREPAGADSEWADCFDGCEHAFPDDRYDLATFTADGLYGIIDGNSHAYSAAGIESGPDIDIIALSAPPRTMVEIVAEPSSDNSQFRPVIQTHDGFRQLTHSAGIVDGFPGARTIVASPYVGELPFYVVVEHIENYDKLRSIDAPSETYVGGTDYSYVLRFRTWSFAPTEITGLSSENPTVTLDNQVIGCGGDIVYYLIAGDSGLSPTVTVTRTGSADLTLLAATMKTTGGDQLVWYNIVNDTGDAGPGDGQVVLTPDQFDTGGSGEWIFAVTDYNGLGQDDFTYRVSVTIPQ